MSSLFSQVQIGESHSGCQNPEFGDLSVLVLEWASDQGISSPESEGNVLNTLLMCYS